MNDVIIEKLNGGLNRRNPSNDNVSGLLANGVDVVGGVQLDTNYTLKSVKDAEAILIDASYDSTNSVLVYEHINEFFRVNPDGTLHIRLVAQTVVYADLVDKTKTHGKSLLEENEGVIKRLGVAYNPATAVTDFTQTSAAIPKAQELAAEEETLHRPVQIHLEGKGFLLTAPVNFRALNSKNVSVVIGQSYSIGKTQKTYAGIGTELGARSKAAVNENTSWVEKFNLLGGSLQVPSINGKLLSEITQAAKDSLNHNGAIFFKRHTGIEGIYINDTHTCTEVTSDYAYQENVETMDKASRLIRVALLPYLGASVVVDEATGQLSPEIVKSYEATGRRALEQMLSASEVSAIDVNVDPNQNILSTSELAVEFSIVPTGTNRKITATIGFVNPF